MEAGGLSCLQKVLVIWMRNPQTHPGVLLLLKVRCCLVALPHITNEECASHERFMCMDVCCYQVLAALPGVTSDMVLQSNIGRTLRGIANVCQTMDHVDQVLGDLSEWIIRSWKRNVIHKGLNMSAKDLIKGNSSEVRAASVPLLYVPPPPNSEKSMTEKQMMTNHLRKLMTGAVHTEKAAGDEEEEEVVFLPRFNSLGSEDARRPVRQTILIDSLAAKINREHVEGMRKRQEQVEAEANGATSGDVGATTTTLPAVTKRKSIWDAEGKDEVAVGRLLFGRPQILQYNRNIAVVNLLSTVRSRVFDRQATAIGDDDALGLDGRNNDDDVPPAELPPPNKRTTPSRSILKKSNEELVPASQVKWS